MTSGRSWPDAAWAGTNRVMSARWRSAGLLTVIQRSPSGSKRRSEISIVRNISIRLHDNHALGVPAGEHVLQRFTQLFEPVSARHQFVQLKFPAPVVIQNPGE